MLSGLGNIREGIIYRLDPRLRVVLTLAFAFLLVACQSWTALLAGLGLALLLVLLTRAAWAAGWRRLRGITLFVLLIALFMPLSVPGPVFFALGPLEWSTTGLALAARIGLKGYAVMLFAGAMLATLEPAYLGHALSRLGVPEKFVHLLLFMIRYIDVIEQEYLRLRSAMRCRAFRPGCNLHALRSIGYLLGMLFVRSIERAERIVEAMKCRGFAGRFYILQPLRFCRADLVGAAFFCVALAGLGYLEWR